MKLTYSVQWVLTLGVTVLLALLLGLSYVDALVSGRQVVLDNARASIVHQAEMLALVAQDNLQDHPTRVAGEVSSVSTDLRTDTVALVMPDGIVVAGTGNGTVSAALEASLHMACKAGIAVCLTTRCLQGSVVKNDNHAFNVLPLSPVQARIELILQLMHKLDV